MRLFNVARFMDLHGHSGILYDMRRFPRKSWISRLFRNRRTLYWDKGRALTSEERGEFDNDYALREQECLELGLTASVATIRKIRLSIGQSGSTHGEYWEFGRELQDRLVDEMRGRLFLSLSLIETDYYSNSREKWAEIIISFPGSQGDIEEAGRCFALGRYAASVFHSLQVVELGVIELGRIVGVTDHRTGWTATTHALEKILKKRKEDRTAFEHSNFGFFEQIHATVDSLKNAWRNKISHAQNKLAVMTSDFSPDIAEEILLASRGFMRRLATDAPAPEPSASAESPPPPAVQLP